MMSSDKLVFDDELTDIHKQRHGSLLLTDSTPQTGKELIMKGTPIVFGPHAADCKHSYRVSLSANSQRW